MSIFDSKLLISVKNNMEKNYIKDPIFVQHPPRTLSLTDPIVVYTDNMNIKIVPLTIMKQYPIIHDTYFEDGNDTTLKNKALPITITFCPYSYTIIAYFGTFKMTGEIYNGNVILTDENNHNKIIQLTGQEYKNGILTEEVFRRRDVKIMTFRNAISIYQDAIFLNTNNLHKIKIKYDEDFPLLNYIKDDKHNTDPKTLIYGVEYMSSKDDSEMKHTAIIGKIKRKSYEYKSSGYHKYITKMGDDLQNKGAILIPCFIYIWYAFYPKTKMIKL